MSALTPARPCLSPLSDSSTPTLCWYCDAAADRIDPPGWVTIKVSHKPGLTYTTGVCPTCLVVHHKPPYRRATS